MVEVGRIRDYGSIEGIWLRSILLVARLYFNSYFGTADTVPIRYARTWR